MPLSDRDTFTIRIKPEKRSPSIGQPGEGRSAFLTVISHQSEIRLLTIIIRSLTIVNN